MIDSDKILIVASIRKAQPRASGGIARANSTVPMLYNGRSTHRQQPREL